MSVNTPQGSRPQGTLNISKSTERRRNSSEGKGRSKEKPKKGKDLDESWSDKSKERKKKGRAAQSKSKERNLETSASKKKSRERSLEKNASNGRSKDRDQESNERSFNRNASKGESKEREREKSASKRKRREKSLNKNSSLDRSQERKHGKRASSEKSSNKKFKSTSVKPRNVENKNSQKRSSSQPEEDCRLADLKKSRTEAPAADAGRKPEKVNTSEVLNQSSYLDAFILEKKAATCTVCPGAKPIPKAAAYKHSQTLKHFKNLNSNKAAVEQRNNGANVDVKKARKSNDRNVSMFGRQRKNSSFLNSDSWVDCTPEPSLHTPPPPLRTKQNQATSKATKQPKSILKARKTKEVVASSKAKERVVVKNPFKRREAEKPAEPAGPKTAAPVHELVANPKTVKERRKNQEILEQLNRDHEDDMFLGDVAKGFNLAGSLDDTDASEIRSKRISILVIQGFKNDANNPLTSFKHEK